MKNIILAVITTSFLFYSCEKQNRCASRFEIPVEIIPYGEEYRIGDTITIKSKFSRYVWEVNLMKSIDMGGVNWKPTTGIRNMDTLGVVQLHTFNDFKFINNETYDYDYFFYSDGGSDLIGRYNYQNDTFDLEVKLVPQKAGMYQLAQYSFIAGLGLYEEHEAKCTNTDYDAYTNMNDGKDNNFDLLYESPEPFFNMWIPQKPDQRFHNSGGYCFRVVE